ncbi:MAG: hypothetical protein LQ352_000843 [Teloschistes flavicans]|nr:MAG: hypothetical protein LQ352_000843 [Teloschistes flavicans]
MSVAHFASPFKWSDSRVLDERLAMERKRGEDTFEHSSFDPLDSLRPSSPSCVPLNQGPSNQYRSAGQPSNDSLYPYPLPHAPLKTQEMAKSSIRDSELTSELIPEDMSILGDQSDNDGLQTVVMSRSSTKPGLRQQHYTVLTSLLHRCILERDYGRASRAWGMLLRLETHGHPLDIRNHERWGIGAELLLHSNGDHDNQLTLENLNKAKDYYERLILQYPYRKTAPDATSSLKFYPLMFGIWIYSIQLRYRLATQTMSRNLNRRHTTESSGDSDSDSEASQIGMTSTPFYDNDLARQITIQQARGVVERLSELLLSPPFSDHAGLWRIQGMLFVWISQLLSHDKSSGRRSGSSDDDSRSRTSATHSSSSSAEPTGPPQDNADLQYLRSECQEARLKAREAFLRALALGCSVDSQTMQELGL